MPELELESRREIFAHIRENPGVHFRAILDVLDYAQGTLQYHLRWLTDEGLVDATEDGNFTRYYATGSFDDADRDVMNALRRERARRILGHLYAEGPLTTTELAARLGKSASTVSWHLAKLEDATLVEKTRDGRAVRYSLADPDRVASLYTVHRNSFTDRIVDRLFDLWETY